jgi:exopolysaccharide biosynthesis polyprenyl glycosylphosphotransferase
MLRARESFAVVDWHIGGEKPLGPRPVVADHSAVLAGSKLAFASKSILDIILSFTVVALLLPLFVLISILIKLESPGPVFFLQLRNGLHGRPFKIIKFRTMHCLEDGADVRQVAPGDPRVTKVGKILRRTSLDELPQLLNVLRGDMSLVGPRPLAIAHNEAYKNLIHGYMFRHLVKPGITGWAQINGARGATPLVVDVQRRFELDVWYIENWKPTLDLKIILRTLPEILSARAC